MGDKHPLVGRAIVGLCGAPRLHLPRGLPGTTARIDAMNCGEPVPEQAYFRATHQGAELDLLLFKGGYRVGIEIKRADAPAITSSMRIALGDFGLDRLIYCMIGQPPAGYAVPQLHS